jgi:hypothetical protein
VVRNLTADEHFSINSFIDASFACHPDIKSHTGQFTSLGGGAISTKSSKQRLVTKSSTEAELVGLSDGLSQVLWIKILSLSRDMILVQQLFTKITS